MTNKTASALVRRKSDTGSWKSANNEAIVAAELPWGNLKVVQNMGVDFGILPAKFSAQSLLLEIISVFERKLTYVCNEEPLDKVLSKTLKRGEDVYVDNLLRTLNGVCETCLPSVLSAFIKWYEEQQRVPINETGEARDRIVKRTLGAGYLFCVVLIEILPQIHYHPSECEQSVNKILTTSFKQISYRDPAVFGINYNNSLIVAETFAEVIGVLSQSHFKLVQDTFFTLLNDLRKETPFTTNTIRQIISLLMGMKFFRIKTSQVFDFEMGVGFLDELGSYYLEVDLKQKDLKHALAGLLVEILLPIAAQIRTEANIPALIAFVNRLYSPTYELVNKKQHKMAAYPLLTCLLCISQSKFFLDNWVQFLNLTLANLKNKDPKISRVALESLYRLLWVYIIRNNCEGNTATRTRLESICSSLFPRGNRSVVPRDAPLNIFVKIIHFIGQQKLDFAFREIIFDLLGCNRASRSISIYPERMNIGIRALMVIADGLQQKDGPPGMPRTMGPIASGTMQRTKKTYLTRPLTADVARSLGLEQYYLPCRKAFDGVIRTLDAQVGRPLMLISAQTKGKEPEDILGGDVKPKLDLFRTCIAAIPRLLPEPMPFQELIELITRMCVHMDEELRATACQTLQNLISECVDWREDIITTYLNFLTNQIQDTFPTLLESAVRFLLQLLCALKNAVQQEKKKEQDAEANGVTTRPTSAHSALSGITSNGKSSDAASASDYRSSSSNIASDLTPNHYSSGYSDGGSPNTRLRLPPSNSPMVSALHSVEGFALVLLCQLRTPIKKISISLLKEVRNLLNTFTTKEHDIPVVTVLDDATPYVLNKFIEHVPLSERQSWTPDFASACDKICNLEPDPCFVNQDKGNEYMRWDPWACALSGYTEYQFLIAKCPTAVAYAWPALFIRLNACNQYVDPSNPQNENRASLLRSSKSKATASSICGESLSQESYLSLWQKYLVMCCALTPVNSQSVSTLNRSFSPSASIDLETIRSMTSSIRLTRAPTTSNGTQLFQKLTTMIRWEHMTDMRDSVALGIGSLNPACFELFLEELNSRGILREAQDKKVESNVRRRKRKDLLRLQLVRIIEVALFRRTLEFGSLIDSSGKLNPLLCNFVDSIRHNVQSDLDRDMLILTSTRLHYAKIVTLIINGISPDRRKSLIPDEVRQALFLLFFSWCGRAITPVDRRRDSDVGTYVEQNAVHAMCALLCCGPMFEVGGSLNDEDYPYRWLEALLASSNLTVQTVCEETLSLVLHLNDHNTQLFEWVVQMCYTKSSLVSTRCFKALVMLFSQREFPCDFVCLFVLCQVFMDGEASVQESAVLLLQILRQHFLDDMFSSSGASLSDTNLAKSLEAVCKLDDDSNGCPRPFAMNQGTISRQLSKAYPQLTMPIFSEVCSRMESARPIRQASMLSFLLQWIANVELVDPTCEFATDADGCAERDNAHGWGSAEATQLLLNNLFYMTWKWSSDHNNEIAALWKCLASSYSSNLPIILHYFFVMISLSPDFVIPVAKKICAYLIDASSERLVSLLMQQLTNTTDHFKMILLRSEMPPYYRWQVVQQEEVQDVDDESDDEEAKDDHKPHQSQKNEDNDLDLSNNTASPKQLPMPAYGGYYANLSSLLPPTTQAVHLLSRSNLSLFLLADLIGMDPSCQIQWSDQAHVILQIAVIGLDSMRPLVCRHSRSAILNLCLLYASGCKNLSNVAAAILHNQIRALRNEVLEKHCLHYGCESEHHKAEDGADSEEHSNSHDGVLYVEACRQKLLHSNEVFTSRASLLLAIVTVLSDKMERPLWQHEEPTARWWKTDSADHLACFVQHVAEFFLPFIPALAANWTQYSVSLALSTSNRHIAGRSFQVASSLCQSPTPYATSLLSRLAEYVGEANEDAQSYITQMVLSLHNSVPFLVIRGDASPTTYTSGHSRSISYTPALLQRIQAVGQQAKPDSTPVHGGNSKKDTRHSMLIEGAVEPPAPLSRSKSATMLKMDASSTITDDDMNTLCLLLSSSVALLESHVDNEFLLSLTLVDKLFTIAGSHIDRCLENLEKTVAQMDWTGFPGVIGLVSKGTLYANGYEATVSLLVKCISHLEHSSVATSSSNAFALIVVSSLPHCLVNFENPTEQCCNAAQAVAEYCMKKLPDALKEVPELSEADHPLHNLATMMNQYRERGFQRDRFQWAKCVVNYLVEAFSPNIVQLVVFLSEMLERCQPSLHVYLLHMIYLFVGHSRADLKDSSPVPLNAQVIRVVSKHVQGVNWREAARILKCFVDQWSTISVSQVPQNELCPDQRKPNFELYVEKETLSGSNSPQTPRKAGGGQSAANADSLKRQTNPSQSKVRERLVRLLTASGLQVGLPRSSSAVFVQSTADVRQDVDEVGNITANASNLPIASTSAFSSTERISHQDDYDTMSGSSLAAPGEQSSITTDSFPRVFKEFDFLEAEHDSISESTESCFNWLSTMRQPRCSDENAEEEADDALTDELEDDFIHPDDGELSEQSHGARLRSTVAQRGLTGFMGRGRRPLSAASDSNDISSDRTPIQSEKHSDESCPSCPASDEDYDEESDRKSHADSRPVASTPDDASSTRYTAGEDNTTFGETTTYANAETASSIQCRSEFSVRQGSSEQISKPPIYLECSHHTSGRVEQAWMSFVADIANDQDGELTAHSVLLLSQLLRESSSKLSGLLRDASHLLTTPTTPQTARARDIATYFTHALHAAMRVTDCPFVFVTAQFLRHSNLLQSQKFCLYELREHFETFSERREQCIRALNTVKSAQRFLSLNASPSPSINTSTQEVELCKALHKLFFQLHQMLEKLHEMIRSIQQSPSAGDYDLSPAVASLQHDLLTCLSEVPPSESRTSSTSLNASRSDLQTDSLVLHLTNKNYKSALVTLRQLRGQYGNEFGCCDHMDLEMLLLQFCRSHSMRTWAIVGSTQSLEQSVQSVKETNMQLAALVHSLVADANMSRLSRMSSVNDAASFNTAASSNQYS